MDDVTIGFALCGSFCTFGKLMEPLKILAERYSSIIPILSNAAASIDSRFGPANHWKGELEKICGRPPLTDLEQVEPFGPRSLLDILVIAPCTGNTLGKLASGIADTAPTLACKAHLRNERPVVLAVSTNDGLSGNASSIGALLNRKYYYFVPFGQDDPRGKPRSLVADFRMLPQTIDLALKGKQIQPMLL